MVRSVHPQPTAYCGGRSKVRKLTFLLLNLERWSFRRQTWWECFSRRGLSAGSKFFAVESGVTSKCDTDFQNTANRNIFRIELR
jgi:hypothetical protein